MVASTLRISKLNDNRYEVSLEDDHGSIKCFVRAKLPGPELPKGAEREPERKQFGIEEGQGFSQGSRHGHHRDPEMPKGPKGERRPADVIAYQTETLPSTQSLHKGVNPHKERKA